MAKGYTQKEGEDFLWRFLVLKTEVPDMHVGMIMESNDANFFEDIFPMKDMSTSSNQDMPSSSNQEPVTITVVDLSRQMCLWKDLVVEPSLRVNLKGLKRTQRHKGLY